MNEQNKCVICGAIGNHIMRIMPFSLNNPNLMCIDCALRYSLLKLRQKKARKKMSTKINNADSPAHPCKIPNYENPANNYTEHHGITKREYFAAVALQGLLTRLNADDGYNAMTWLAVDIADALLSALEPKDG